MSEIRGQKSENKSKASGFWFLVSGFWLPLFAFYLSGCSFRSIALKSTVDILSRGTEAVQEENDLRFAEESMASQLKVLEVLLKNDPTHPELVLLTVQGFGAYAFLFLDEKEPARAKIFYERGKSYGMRYLQKKTVPHFADLEPELFVKTLKKIKLKDIPILFWTAYCWGGLANLSRDDPNAVAELPKIEQMMLRVNELLPGYFYSGADIFLGAYYGSRPKFFGGDPEKSRFYFERALKVSNEKFLMAFVLFALHYAIPLQEKELFQELLLKVEQFQAELFPEQRLSNEIAKRKAKKLLEEIDEHF